MKVIRGYNL